MRFTLENRSHDSHKTRLSLAGLPKGDYDILLDGQVIASLNIRDREPNFVSIAVGFNDCCQIEIVKLEKDMGRGSLPISEAKWSAVLRMLIAPRI